MYALLVIGGLNTVISLVYYIKVLKVMTPREAARGYRRPRAAAALRMPWASALYSSLLAAAVVVLAFAGLVSAGAYSQQGVSNFRVVERDAGFAGHRAARRGPVDRKGKCHA